MRALPPPAFSLSAGGPNETPRLPRLAVLGKAGSFLRRPECPAADHRPGAPGAHGSNRTGRMFTGDSSGDFLYDVLFKTGFASQPYARHRNDGLSLSDAYITAAVHCAPPQNKPAKEEFLACRPYLEREMALLTRVRVVLVLGAACSRFLLGSLARVRAHRTPLSVPFCPRRVSSATRRLAGPALFLSSQPPKHADRPAD